MWRSGTAAWIVGTLAAPGTQGCQWPQEQEIALLGFFLASGSSAPVGIKCRGGTVALIMGTLAMPVMEDHHYPFFAGDTVLLGFVLTSGTSA